MSTSQYISWVDLHVRICHEYLSVYVTSTCLYVTSTSQYISWVDLHVRIWHEYLSVYVTNTCLYVMSTSQYISWLDLHVRICHEYLSIYLATRWTAKFRARQPRTDVQTVWGSATLTVPVPRIGL